MKDSTRREFLKHVAAGTAATAIAPALLASGARAAPEPPGGQRPNILWISAEDISPTLGCYGDAYATTPNLDRLAAQSVRYDRAFTHAPVCAPSRSGIITGMYPTTIGTTWMRCQGVPPPEARCFPEYLRGAGYFCTNNVKTDYQFAPPPSAWDLCSKTAHWRHRPDAGQPFFAVFNFTVTHESSTRQWKPGKQQHDPAKAPLPPYYPDTPIVRQNVACYYDRMSELDAQARKVLDELEADGLADDTIVWFWGDHGWGLTRGKRWVYDSGTRVPLLVRVPEKWRAWAGAGEPRSVAPGAVEGEFAAFIDFAPTVLSLAGVPIPKPMQGRAFLGPQKGKPPEYVFAARDRMDETIDCIRALRDKRFKYVRNFMPYLPRSQPIDYMDQTPILQEMRRLAAEGRLEPGPRMQFFEPAKPAHELYDTVADPHEIHNLADDPKFKDVVERMSAALGDFLKRIGDVGLIPEPDFDAAKGGGKTAAPVFCRADGDQGGDATRLALACPTPGASVVYQVGPAGRKADAARPERWLLYARPVEVGAGEVLRAKACRLGYAGSPVSTFRRGDALAAAAPAADAEPLWREKLKPTDLIARILAVKAFDGRWAEGVDAYLGALKDPDGPVRYWAAVGLHQAVLAGASPDAVRPALEPLLADASPSVPVAAAHALVDCGRAEKGLARLVELLQAPLEKTRLLAAHSLERLGEKARPVLDRMEAALDGQPRYPGDVLKRAVAALKKA